MSEKSDSQARTSKSRAAPERFRQVRPRSEAAVAHVRPQRIETCLRGREVRHEAVVSVDAHLAIEAGAPRTSRETAEGASVTPGTTCSTRPMRSAPPPTEIRSPDRAAHSAVELLQLSARARQVSRTDHRSPRSNPKSSPSGRARRRDWRTEILVARMRTPDAPLPYVARRNHELATARVSDTLPHILTFDQPPAPADLRTSVGHWQSSLDQMPRNKRGCGIPTFGGQSSP